MNEEQAKAWLDAWEAKRKADEGSVPNQVFNSTLRAFGRWALLIATLATVMGNLWGLVFLATFGATFVHEDRRVMNRFPDPQVAWWRRVLFLWPWIVPIVLAVLAIAQS